MNFDISKTFNKAMFKIDKHSPEILIATGVAGFVGTIILACRATIKAQPILEEHQEKLETIKSNDADDETSKKEVALAYCSTVKDVVKVYSPAIVCGVASVSAVLVGANIFHNRNVALAAAYATIDKGFRAYRDRVIDRFGEEVDKELRFGTVTQKITEVVTDENGKEKKTKKNIPISDYDGYSDYARFFDEASAYWEDDSEMNLVFLKAQQNYANDKLIAQGHLYLNEVYDMLGIPRTKAGQIVGWVYNFDNPVGDNYVDFGIYQTNRAIARDFVNGYEKVILLDFNVDGNILDLM